MSALHFWEYNISGRAYKYWAFLESSLYFMSESSMIRIVKF
ncbi:hypothetical protein CLOSTASPAR_03834 [[Clostridium] asparagiforme DSM 15981]|uniref:Uncharacterized protein n=1 Tax=[Clostridium] asparagiforme DSM 15981 TaxID=518636 RepID=C0D3J3_9FIRM|nr:hypothetical protein CLOSTASPAR_03834 [[Clostridium] asparagiforme DSM 15981]